MGMWNDLKSSIGFVFDGAKTIRLDVGLKRFWEWIKGEWKK